eukprot:scaffold13932_cov172-Skeletonema_dohrnii-CCMP3373.AAC.1
MLQEGAVPRPTHKKEGFARSTIQSVTSAAGPDLPEAQSQAGDRTFRKVNGSTLRKDNEDVAPSNID